MGRGCLKERAPDFSVEAAPILKVQEAVKGTKSPKELAKGY